MNKPLARRVARIPDKALRASVAAYLKACRAPDALAASVAELEQRGVLPVLQRRGAPRKSDSPARAAWREQKARRRALLALL